MQVEGIRRGCSAFAWQGAQGSGIMPCRNGICDHGCTMSHKQEWVSRLG
jgi:hypothetical protein